MVGHSIVFVQNLWSAWIVLGPRLHRDDGAFFRVTEALMGSYSLSLIWTLINNSLAIPVPFLSRAQNLDKSTRHINWTCLFYGENWNHYCIITIMRRLMVMLRTRRRGKIQPTNERGALGTGEASIFWCYKLLILLSRLLFIVVGTFLSNKLLMRMWDAQIEKTPHTHKMIVARDAAVWSTAQREHAIKRKHRNADRNVLPTSFSDNEQITFLKPPNQKELI